MYTNQAIKMTITSKKLYIYLFDSYYLCSFMSHNLNNDYFGDFARLLDAETHGITFYEVRFQ